MYIYHALINALSAHMIRINLNMIFYTHFIVLLMLLLFLTSLCGQTVYVRGSVLTVSDMGSVLTVTGGAC